MFYSVEVGARWGGIKGLLHVLFGTFILDELFPI